MAVPELLFATKLQLPQRRPGLVRRERLLTLLQGLVERRLLLVVAPAGYGKTTLLRDFADAVGVPVCWYSLDPTDTDLKQFLRYLLATFQQQCNEVGARSRRLLAESNNVARDLPAIVDALVNDIHTSGPDLFLIVLDDYHYVDDSPEVANALNLLLAHLPDNCRVVLSSRNVPQLALARLAAQYQLGGISARDIRFTPSEVCQVLDQTLGLGMTEVAARQIAERFNGWIAGIQLAFQSRRGVESGLEDEGTVYSVFHFLAQEMYSQFPRSVRQFLTGSAVLKRLEPGRCDLLLGRDDSALLLEDLLESNVLLDRFEGEPLCYRYHDLFRRFLLHQLYREGTRRMRELHRRAAALALEEDDIQGALDYYRQGSCLPELADALEAHGDVLFQAGRWRLFRDYLNALPRRLVKTRPTLGWHQARVEFKLGNLDQVRPTLRRVEAQFRQAGDRAAVARCLVLTADVLRTEGRLRQSLAACHRAVELVSEDDLETAVVVRTNLGVSLGMLGQLDVARQEFQEALRAAEQIDDRYRIAMLHELIGRTYSGIDIPSALHYYEESLRGWEQLGNAGSAGSVLIGIAYQHHYAGRHSKAEALFQEALNRTRQGGFAQMEGFALLGLGDVSREQDHLQPALDYYEQALAIATHLGSVSLIAASRLGIGESHRLAGDLSTAELMIRQALQQCEDHDLRETSGQARAALGALLLTRGAVEEARRVLDEARVVLEQTGPRRVLARAWLYLAEALSRLGDNMAPSGLARDYLARADKFAEELCDAQSFRDEVGRIGGFVKGESGEHNSQGDKQRASDALVSPSPPLPFHRPSVVAPPKHTLVVRALGTPQVICDDHPIQSSQWRSSKALELFFFLLSHPSGVHREQVMEALWPDAPPGPTQLNLYQTVLRMRRALYSEVVQHDRPNLRLQLDGVTLDYDVANFLALLDDAREPSATASHMLECYHQAVARYHGPYLEGIYSDWLERKRAGLAERYLEALATVARLHTQRGEFALAAEHWRQAVVVEPYAEDLRQHLIECYVQLGDLVTATHQYREYVSLLDRELNTKPSPELANWYRHLVSNRAR